MSRNWGSTIQAAKAAAAASAPAPGPTAGTQDNAANSETNAPALAAPTAAPVPPPQPRPRMIDRRDGAARLEYVFVEGKIRGGKRSNQWGRPRNNASREGWVGACLPAESRMLLKRLTVEHDLHEWQVLVEAIDLFKKTHGDGT